MLQLLYLRRAATTDPADPVRHSDANTLVRSCLNNVHVIPSDERGKDGESRKADDEHLCQRCQEHDQDERHPRQVNVPPPPP